MVCSYKHIKTHDWTFFCKIDLQTLRTLYLLSTKHCKTMKHARFMKQHWKALRNNLCWYKNIYNIAEIVVLRQTHWTH